jgi:hypothetical protein
VAIRADRCPSSESATILAVPGPLIVNRREQPIRSVEEWGVLAKPASPVHWQDGRSAKELAKAWIDGTGPDVLGKLLARDARTADLRVKKATAEAQTAFDSLPGGRRNHDLLVEGDAAGGPTIVGLEGKADESFGETLDGFGRAAQRKADRGERTNAPQRLERLLADLAGTSLEARPELGKLRYQLFSGVAGTLAAAGRDDQAVFVVHEFQDPEDDATQAQRQCGGHRVVCRTGLWSRRAGRGGVVARRTSPRAGGALGPDAGLDRAPDNRDARGQWLRVERAPSARSNLPHVISHRHQADSAEQRHRRRLA